MVHVKAVLSLRNLHAAFMLRQRQRAMADVVVDFHVLIVFEWQLDGEVHRNSVVMDAAVFKLAALDSIVPVALAHLSAREAVVVYLRILGPHAKDSAAGDAALITGNPAALPAAACINEFAIMNL